MTARDDQRRRRHRTERVRQTIGGELRGLRVEAGLSGRAVAGAAGISASHLCEIEAGRSAASTRALVAVADVLGADLSIRAFPNTGPRIHDRFQAPIVEAVLRLSRDTWEGHPEVAVFRPARGSIDLVLAHRLGSTLVATEVYSELRRLEQQLRWCQDKTASLPSSDLWRHVPADIEVSSLLVLRSTAENRELVDRFAETIASVYPARPAEIHAALTGHAPWPGAGLIWASVDRGKATILDRPPRGVRFRR